MASNGLQLNIPGAQADVAAMNVARAGIEDTASQLKSTSTQLFNGTLLGVAADAGSDFSMQIDSAVNSCNDVINACSRVVNQASDDTIGFDRGGFAGVFG
jgi:hypothetical protein